MMQAVEIRLATALANSTNRPEAAGSYDDSWSALRTRLLAALRAVLLTTLRVGLLEAARPRYRDASSQRATLRARLQGHAKRQTNYCATAPLELRTS